ncbi:hypothetical protein B0H10DRAFT_1925605 [Mycena sp. CBHHK59/15]|nr:hypothetical protein B0H10DRAFT_1925605 [Mycena sp. CBHHK59/15]
MPWQKTMTMFWVGGRCMRSTSSSCRESCATIPGVSIAVERLFSSSKHTMSDARSSMAASTASSTVVAKELLNAGFGEGLDYLEGVSIH